MNQIESFTLRDMHNNEHFQFLTEVDVLITRLLPDELGLGEAYPPFKEALATEEKALKTEQGSSKSKAIEESNKKRGRTWNAIHMKVKSNLNSPLDDEVQSAGVIKHILDSYDDPRKMNYPEATTTITNLISDLQAPAYTAHLEKIVLTAWVGELKKQNSNFISLSNERDTELAGRESGNVQAPRQVIDPLYKKIVKTVNATIELKMAKPAAANFVSELNQKIKHYKTIINAREGRNNNKKDNGDQTPPKA